MRKLLFIYLLTVLASCSEEEKLPVLGRRSAETKIVDGKEVVDTIYQTVPKFSFTNQDGETITNDYCKGKIYTADFFFTTCPSICPVAKKNMLSLQEEFVDDDRIVFLSHSLDPSYDTPAVLKSYAEKLGVKKKGWQFLTGSEEKIYEMAVNSYLIAAVKDNSLPGGIDHSGNIMLIDTKGRLRGFYEGTKKEEIERLIADAKTLMNEEF